MELATRLRHAGVDAILDMWDLQPGDDLPVFMERNLVSADRIIMVCTEKYVEKANAGSGGVGYEKMIATADLMRNIDSNKVVPLIRQSGTRKVPTFLSTKLFLDFSKEDQFEFSFDELVRTFHKAPLFVKPAIGEKPTFDAPPPVPKSGDPFLLVMKIAVILFESESSSEYLSYSSFTAIAKSSGMSRMYFDVLLREVCDAGLLRKAEGFFVITEKGRLYAMENKLV